VVSEVFNKLDLEVVIKVNNRKLLTGILSQAGIKKQEEAIIAIDKLGKIGQTGVTKELNERGYSKKQIDSVFNLIKENVSLATLKKQVTDPTGKEGLDELQELFNYLKQLKIESVKFDVSLARGLAYYTGTVFEVFLKKGKITSSLAGGGRYDNMIGNFMGGGRQVPAVGLSFGLEPIADTLQLQEKIVNAGSQVYIVPIKTISGSLQIARQLREAGITTSFSIGKKGVTKNLQYANALGIPYVIILGPEEVKKNKVLLRNMKTGEESLLTLKQVIKKLT
ncbi:histidine--tRNA ligase, partial [Candidatus Woesearchaeota archaeon]|nr:histidine--tRNA ligase [Candidatus Woesearchaeota archaeon]